MTPPRYERRRGLGSSGTSGLINQGIIRGDPAAVKLRGECLLELERGRLRCHVSFCSELKCKKGVPVGGEVVECEVYGCTEGLEGDALRSYF